MRDLQRPVTRPGGVGLEDPHGAIPAVKVVGCAGGGSFTAEKKRVGLQRSSANRGDSCARWEVPEPWLSVRGGWGVDFFVASLAGEVGCPLVTCSSIFYTQIGTFLWQE